MEKKIAKLELVRIDKDGKEAILEETLVPDSWTTDRCSFFYPKGCIEELEAHYKKTGKPKKSKIDAIYICRPQVERWTDKELEMNSNLKEARRELQKRRGE